MSSLPNLRNLTPEQERALEQRRSGKFSPDHLLHRLKRTASSVRDARPYFEDRVLVRRERVQHKGDTLIAHVDLHGESDRDKVGTQTGIVVAIAEPNGRGSGHEPCCVKPGDRVLYHRAIVHEFEEAGELYSFLNEDQHIIAVLEES